MKLLNNKLKINLTFILISLLFVGLNYWEIEQNWRNIGKSQEMTGQFTITSSANRKVTTSTALPTTVKVGALVPLTGSEGFIGPGILDGIKAAALEINGSSEFLFDIELQVEDTGSTSATTISAYNTLSAAGAELIIGPALSTNALAIVDQNQVDQNVLISYLNTAPFLSNSSLDYYFRTIPSDANQTEALAEVMYNLNHRTITLVHQNGTYSTSVANTFINQFTSLGGTIDSSLNFSIGTSNIGGLISSIDPMTQAILVISFWSEGNAFITQARPTLSAPIFSTDTIIENNNLASNPQAGKVMGTKNVAGSSGLGRYDTFLSSLAICNTSGECTEGNTPRIFADYAYDAMYIGALAINKSTNYDGTEIKNNMPTAGASYIGATGNKTFSSVGDPAYLNVEFWQVQGGQIVTVGKWTNTEGIELNTLFQRQYMERGPISINGIGQFISTGFTGSGTQLDPYVLEGYNITAPSTLISISNTEAYFIVRNNLFDGLNGGFIAISFGNVDNGTIEHNTIFNAGSTGNPVLNLDSLSGQNMIRANTIYNSQSGISLVHLVKNK